MTDAKPYPKSQQLARLAKRYRRKVAGRKTWEQLRDEKLGPCRVHGAWVYREELHHLVRRNDGGDDVADNLVPLCVNCHDRIHARDALAAEVLLDSLTIAEWDYIIERGGPGYVRRAYGIEYRR